MYRSLFQAATCNFDPHFAQNATTNSVLRMGAYNLVSFTALEVF